MVATRSVRVAMLNADIPVPNVRAKAASYGAIFQSLLAAAASRIRSGTSIHSSEFDVVQGQYPEELADFDAILITGSAASAHDDAEWIRRLDAYVLDVYQNHPRIRMFGSCFGHQLLCQSLLREFGVCVEKDPNGWELGVQEITLSPRFCEAVGRGQSDSQSLRLQFVHADHVKIPEPERWPDSWILVGSTSHCVVQGVYEPERVLTLQGHFEFDRFINSETLKVFGAAWEPWRLDQALKAIDADDDAERAAEMVARFLTEGRSNRNAYDSGTEIGTALKPVRNAEASSLCVSLLAKSAASDSHQSNDPGIFPGCLSLSSVVVVEEFEFEAVFMSPRDVRSMTHGLQLLPQQSPAAGFVGFSSLIAALKRADSRAGASRDFRRRAKVGECFRASKAVAVAAMAPALELQ
ncbi:hypothetical protein JX265_011910 [Neoarthrinium moseri]|uniref:Class I glutamine amidotransferase-like protein n=1 Tax=Neoarthrinium moseri TaxID=1658444 RepID=A0A9P9WB76_9PEZI|nr:hypothetical protein JX265_011910 [Neoarthrinium moseri]